MWEFLFLWYEFLCVSLHLMDTHWVYFTLLETTMIRNLPLSSYKRKSEIYGGTTPPSNFY